MIARDCADCGGTFETAKPHQRFCSKRCSDRSNQQESRKRKQAVRPVEDELIARLANVTTEWARTGVDGWEALGVAVWPTPELLERLV